MERRSKRLTGDSLSDFYMNGEIRVLYEYMVEYWVFYVIGYEMSIQV